MVIIDRLLEERAEAGNPVRVAMVGAGFMGRTTARQIIRYTPGMELVAIANRTLERAVDAYHSAGIAEPVYADSVADLESGIAAGNHLVTDDPLLLAEAEGIDVLLESTGTIEFSAHVVLGAIEHGKHVVLNNAELDGTVGPILNARARKHGVIYTGCDGDQPGLEMNLFRYVKSIGLTPLLCGNIKGLQDEYRTPATQAGFAEQWGISPETATSAADGTKISFEQAIVANALGFHVPKRGMNGFPFDGPVQELTQLYDVDVLRESGGWVDYVIGAKPPGAVFVLAAGEDVQHKPLLKYYKMGEGPLYCFYFPWHVCHFEVPISLARVVLAGDTIIAPAGPPCVDVIALAKRNLEAGEVLDGLGGYMTYGQAENHEICNAENLLPIGLAKGCRLKQDLVKDSPISYDDVELPPGRLVDKLREEQNRLFDGAASGRKNEATTISR